jgi:hypothetical protein
MIKDIKGRELNIGDEIAYGSSGRGGGLRTGVIYEFPMMPVKVYNRTTRQYEEELTMRIRVELDDGRRTMVDANRVVRLG